MSVLAAVRVRVLRAATPEPPALSFTRMERRQLCLVEIEDRDGCVGLGEAWANHPPWAPAERVRTISEGIAPRLVGRADGPAAAAARLRSELLPLARQAGADGPMWQAISGVEMALWDLLGKRLGTPLATLLGGAARVAVPAYASGIGPDDPPELLDRCRALGFDAVKCRLGFGLARDGQLLEDVRRGLGDEVALYGDANRAWSPQEARTALPRLLAAGLTLLEEPLARDDRRALRRLATSGLRLALGENHHGLDTFVDLTRDPPVDVWQPDVTKVGGVAEMAAICRLAEAAGVRVMPHCYGGPIGLAASLHVAAAYPVVERVEADVRRNPLREELLRRPLVVSDGHLPLPDGPGLGIELDEDTLRRYEERP